MIYNIKKCSWTSLKNYACHGFALASTQDDQIVVFATEKFIKSGGESENHGNE